MTYQQALHFLTNQLPMFQRIGPSAYKASLNTTILLDNIFDSPHKAFKSIHIAGTNGKGSVSHLLASILQESGYKTGLFTSPHLKDFRERIKVNGRNISKKYVVDFITKNKKVFTKCNPSFFEISFALAMKYFKDKKIDIAIIETGMGGRLDSTNIIKPILSIITNVSFDHEQFLGYSIEDIAIEKSGIIKSHVPVIISEYHKKSATVFNRKAKEMQSEIIYAAKNVTITCLGQPSIAIPFNKFRYDKKNGFVIQSGLSGAYQKHNSKAVLCAVEQLRKDRFTISNKDIQQGFKNVVSNTSLLGRWQILNRKPLCIAEAAHNLAGIRQLIECVNSPSRTNLHMVIGFVNDKKIDEILSALPKKATYYFCAASIPRALDAQTLHEKAKRLRLRGIAYPSVKKAYDTALNTAKINDIILVTGSIFVVAELV